MSPTYTVPPATVGVVVKPCSAPNSHSTSPVAASTAWSIRASVSYSE